MIDKVLLFPYYWALKLRNKFYSSPRRKPYVAEVPVVCVGNVTAGGTGKTPHVEMILRMLQSGGKWSGSNIAVLSRGYKRESKGFQQVVVDGSSEMFGDEPLQIKRKFPSVTVAVDKNRVEGAKLVAHPELLNGRKYSKKCWNKFFPPADLVVLDDGFQYRKLKSDLNIVLVDYNRPVYGDMLLPLGRLRDLPERLAEADVLIVSKCPQEMDLSDRARVAESLHLVDYDPESGRCKSAEGKSQYLLFTSVEYAPAEGVFDITEPRFVYSKKIILVTGIANDRALRNYLSDTYKIVARFNFPDHHKYRWSDIDRIQTALRKNPTASIMTTEKDMQRLLDFKGMPKEIRERCFMVPIKTHFLSEADRSAFESVLNGVR
ncbi:MAG TPA: tetraacyldisaccharide 4'-kinase [Rikenellaceae bacterium]|nr:tetraacyldisaccharide 4'-kinase [Rikenellaceae bacterium]